MEKITSYLSFKIGKEFYASSVAYVHNIIEYTEITRVPEMPEYMLGVINLRGQVLPVIDLRLKFGLENTQITPGTCILVMEVKINNQQVFVGTLVDAVAEVIEINDNNIKDTPDIGTTVKIEHISGVYHDGSKFIMILNMNKVIANTDIENMQELTETARA